ncbi:MAG TPA: hypothetical protein VD999_07510 [Vitreimonas sp.]|nr:hypothetical protein [Vitreimonas sp.]
MFVSIEAEATAQEQGSHTAVFALSNRHAESFIRMISPGLSRDVDITHPDFSDTIDNYYQGKNRVFTWTPESSNQKIQVDINQFSELLMKHPRKKDLSSLFAQEVGNLTSFFLEVDGWLRMAQEKHGKGQDISAEGVKDHLGNTLREIRVGIESLPMQLSGYITLLKTTANEATRGLRVLNESGFDSAIVKHEAIDEVNPQGPVTKDSASFYDKLDQLNNADEAIAAFESVTLYYRLRTALEKLSQAMDVFGSTVTNWQEQLGEYNALVNQSNEVAKIISTLIRDPEEMADKAA